jgi:hypothetical protein
MKIFNMDDCTWVAAENIEDAKRALAEIHGYGDTEAGVASVRADFKDYEPEELSDEDLDRLKFHTHPLEDPCPSGDAGLEDANCPVTFREQLESMKRAGATFPCFFATTEY